MSTVDVGVRRPQRWDTPFGDDMSERLVAQLLTMPPFAQMDPGRFPKTCPLSGILLNDARILQYRMGDIVVREGDYGNSAFIILSGSVRVVLESLPDKLLGRPQPLRKNLLQTALQQFFGRVVPERREYGQIRLDQNLGRRGDGSETRIFLQDVPGVLDEHQSLVLNTGEIFGELAAITRTPRSATVIADDRAQLLEIRWQGLRDLMRYDPAIEQQVEALYRQNSLDSHIRETPLLARVSEEGIQAIVAAAQFESYGQFKWNTQYKKVSKQEPSERINAEPIIIEEGESPNDLIMIRSGFARLSRRYGNGHRTLAYLGKGQTCCFEEMACSWMRGNDIPLQSSLRAVGYVDILRIPRPIVEQHVLPTLTKQELNRMAMQVFREASQTQKAESLQFNQSQETSSATLEFLLDERLNNGTKTMLINLDRCTRCDDCVRACASTHDHNPRFIREGPQFENFMVANACMHCVDPVCMIGCPTGAISRDATSGNVLISDLTCIGCATCANSCPYSNIKMVETRSGNGEMILDTDSRQPIVKATKCDLCTHNLGGPACQRACPHDALVRIDTSDSATITQWIQDNS